MESENFSLIICTYSRPKALLKLLISISRQVLMPDEILIIDGSPDNRTQKVTSSISNLELKYYRVGESQRGLTKQRNFGLNKVCEDSAIICFLDDDVVLTPNYFKNLIGTYKNQPKAIGVGGYILENVQWVENKISTYEDFQFDGFQRKLGSRNVLRKKLHLLSNKPPGYMPSFSNGFSTGFLPPSGRTYPVEFFMGGVASYRKDIFEKIQFSPYFKGYGLYEDMDFCIRASQLGRLYVNTAARLYHHHEESGRPNRLRYGIMVIRNGWYVWRVKYPSPPINARIKWHAIALVLTVVRLGNIFNTKKKKEALTEALGRVIGWWSLFISKPIK